VIRCINEMKINDKTLSAFAVLASSIDRHGYLNKKGEVNHSYKTRWFVLKGNLLFYFEKPGDKQPLGIIILENCSVEVSDTDRFSFCIRYQSVTTSTQPRTYILSADNESDMEKWIRSISSASYAYMSMLVDQFETTLAQLQKSDQVIDESEFTLLDVSATAAGGIHMSHSSNSIDTLDGSSTVKHKNKDLNILTAVTNARSKFKTLEGKNKQRTVNTLRRSRSSENVNKITTSKSMSNVKRKSKNQTVKKGHQSYNIPMSVQDQQYVDDDFDKSTFETLHTSYGAAIWLKIGETL